jgi:hypothetical protein
MCFSSLNWAAAVFTSPDARHIRPGSGATGIRLS